MHLLTGTEYLQYVTAGLCLPFPGVTIQEIEAATVVKKTSCIETCTSESLEGHTGSEHITGILRSLF